MGGEFHPGVLNVQIRRYYLIVWGMSEMTNVNSCIRADMVPDQNAC